MEDFWNFRYLHCGANIVFCGIVFNLPLSNTADLVFRVRHNLGGSGDIFSATRWRKRMDLWPFHPIMCYSEVIPASRKADLFYILTVVRGCHVTVIIISLVLVLYKIP